MANLSSPNEERLRQIRETITALELAARRVEIQREIEQNDHSSESLSGELDEAHADIIEAIDILQQLQGKLQKPMDDLLDTKVTAYGFDTRALTTFKRCNIILIGDLHKLTERELLSLPNIGRKTWLNIKEILDSIGLELER